MENQQSKLLPWNLQRFLVASAFAAAAFAAAFALGSLITFTLGPGTSGLATIIITTVLVVLGAKITGMPGVFTLMVTIFTALAIPTSLFGPPGIPKVAIGIATGIVYDIVWWIAVQLHLRRHALPVAAAAATAVSIVLIFFLMVWLGHPRADWMRKFIYYIAPFYAALGYFGGLLGESIYKKRFAMNSRVRLIRGETEN
jgi:hypothetical protein